MKKLRFVVILPLWVSLAAQAKLVSLDEAVERVHRSSAEQMVNVMLASQDGQTVDLVIETADGGKIFIDPASTISYEEVGARICKFPGELQMLAPEAFDCIAR